MDIEWDVFNVVGVLLFLCICLAPAWVGPSISGVQDIMGGWMGVIVAIALVCHNAPDDTPH